MTPALHVVLVLPPGPAAGSGLSSDLWPACRALAAALAPADRLTILDAAPDAAATQGALRQIARFAGECGWPAGVEVQELRLAAPPASPAGWEALARRLAAEGIDRHAGQSGRPDGPEGWLLALSAADRLYPAGLAALRTALAGAPEAGLAICGADWWLGAPGVTLAWPDAGRWPAPGLQDRAAALSLRADPDRMLQRGGIGAGARLARLAGAEPALPLAAMIGESQALLAAHPRALFCPAPLFSTPLPASRATEAVALLTAALPGRGHPSDAGLADGGMADGGALPALAQRLTEELELAEPADLPALLDRLDAGLRALPRRGRAALLAQPGPLPGLLAGLLAALHRGGPVAALPLAALIAAQGNLRRNTALAAALGRLRRDVDVALPGPDYLIEQFDRLRGP